MRKRVASLPGGIVHALGPSWRAESEESSPFRTPLSVLSQSSTENIKVCCTVDASVASSAASLTSVEEDEEGVRASGEKQ